MGHFLLKTEPSAYSIADLARDKKTRWTGIRNYQARNYMTTDMRVGDTVLVYHSNAAPPGVAGLARVSAKAAPDLTQFDAADSHFEPRATRKAPVWFCVELEFVAEATRFVPLEALRADPDLAEMELLRRGSRLSITPVTSAQFRRVVAMAGLTPKTRAKAKAAATRVKEG